MNKEVYLVLEFDNKVIYLPFKSLEDVDNYTQGFDNPLDLVATTIDILNIDIPRNEILDAYLTDNIDELDDMQEFNKRYLSIKYQRDDYDINDLERKFIEYLIFNNKQKSFNEFNGLENVYNNYMDKYEKNILLEKDLKRIALLYLSNSYKRHKECYFILKDNKYKIKTKEKEIKYNEENINKMLEEDKMLLINGTDMNIEELNNYISKQNKGITR